MIKNTAEVQGYFKRHAGANELYFVKGMPFFKEEDARAQSNNLYKQHGVNWPVEKVLRDETGIATATTEVTGNESPQIPNNNMQAQDTENGNQSVEGTQENSRPAKKTRK